MRAACDRQPLRSVRDENSWKRVQVMSVVAGCVAPHPPIIVKEVGGASSNQVAATIDAMHTVTQRLAGHSPDVLVIMSPHSPYLPNRQPVRTDAEIEGSLSAFRAGQVRFRTHTDTELAAKLLELAAAEGLPLTALESDAPALAMSMYGNELDHGVTVPFYFLRTQIGTPILNLGLAFLPYDVHYRIGTLVNAACTDLQRRALFVASGDLSHRLMPGAPAGYDPRGTELDTAIVEALRRRDFDALRNLDPVLVEAGGECGLRSIVTLTGCFEGRTPACEVLSYEGPFGVGYLVAYMEAAA